MCNAVNAKHLYTFTLFNLLYMLHKIFLLNMPNKIVAPNEKNYLIKKLCAVTKIITIDGSYTNILNKVSS